MFIIHKIIERIKNNEKKHEIDDVSKLKYTRSFQKIETRKTNLIESNKINNE